MLHRNNIKREYGLGFSCQFVAKMMSELSLAQFALFGWYLRRNSHIFSRLHSSLGHAVFAHVNAMLNELADILSLLTPTRTHFECEIR